MFCLRSKPSDYGVGVPYQASVCRYYGDGTEWSDGDNDPNIELDGFGLLLWYGISFTEFYPSLNLDAHSLLS